MDTLRADALGLYGDTRGLSPFLNRLGARGLVGQQHTASSSWTRSSLASILTGLDPAQHGLLEVEARLPSAVPTLAERLRAAGFRTGAFVANPIAGTPDLMRGFDTVFAPAPGEAPPRAAELVERAGAWVLEGGEAPFFALVMPFDPHAPYDPLPEQRMRYCPGCPPKAAPSPQREYPNGGPPAERVQRWRDLYAGEVRAVDEALELLHDTLRPLAGRTTWVFTADHGEAFGEHGVFEHAFHLWQEVLHVPLVLAGAGVRPGEIAAPTSHIDLAPTILALAGMPSGPSLLEAVPTDRVLRSEVRMYGIHRLALRQGPLKLVAHAPLDEQSFARYHADPGMYPSVVRGQPELHGWDLGEDPGEARERLDEAGFEPLIEEAQRWLSARPARGEADEALGEALRGLGYLE